MLKFWQENKLFFGALLVLLILEAIFYWPRFSEWQISSDSYEYHKLATNLLEGKGFYLEERGGRTMFREPVYPLFLFLNYKLFGIKPDLIRVEQILVVWLICYLVYQLAQKFVHNKLAKLAALLVAITPLFVIYAGEIISETIATLFLILFCWLLIVNSEKPSWQNTVAAGVTLGLLALTKSIFVPLVILFIPIYWLIDKKNWIKNSLLFFLACILIILPWAYRNHYYFGQWSIAERGGMSAYIHTTRSLFNKSDFKNYVVTSLLSQSFVRLYDDKFDIAQINIATANQERNKLLSSGLSESQVDRGLAQRAFGLWREKPLENVLIGFLELSKANSPTVPRNPIYFVRNLGDKQWQKIGRILGILTIRLVWWGLLILSLYGVYLSVANKKYLVLLMVLFIVYLNGILFFMEGVPRFVFPIYALYYIFFVVAIDKLVYTNK